jgi:XTP/dITP diphosphohydrolase
MEMKALLASLDLQLLTPDQLGLEIVVDETGKTYADNATLKGIAFFRASGLLTLADDSGLEVEALDGAPGLHSARFSPKKGATDADRRALLLRKLRGYPRPWWARFRCVIALVASPEAVHLTEGTCPGEIIPQERGHSGFGYDPIFLLPEVGLTMAELEMEQKNRLSHRGRAVQAAIPFLETLLKR